MKRIHNVAMRHFLPALLVAVSCSGLAAAEKPAPVKPKDAEKTWTFVSMPDFLNVDTTCPQPGWEEALTYVLKAVKAENPDFVLVAGDLVNGHWPSEEKIKKCAAIYYPAWINRMNAHGLQFYAALGDHELGDNPWPPEKAALVPSFRKAFREYMKMPLNGPEHMKGTAFYFLHKNTLFVSVDVFEEGKGGQGEINVQVTGKQLAWLEETLSGHPSVDHIVVMGHAPVLGPVRKLVSSGLMVEGAHRSPFWQSMARHSVDLYMCGEVHAITATESDGILQLAHGSAYGYAPTAHYLIVTVSPKTIELEIKEIDIVGAGPPLWQEGRDCPRGTVSIPEDVKKRGFVSVGRMTIDKTRGKKTTTGNIWRFQTIPPRAE